jgi:hypothetical protein
MGQGTPSSEGLRLKGPLEAPGTAPELPHGRERQRPEPDSIDSRG